MKQLFMAKMLMFAPNPSLIDTERWLDVMTWSSKKTGTWLCGKIHIEQIYFLLAAFSSGSIGSVHPEGESNGPWPR